MGESKERFQEFELLTARDHWPQSLRTKNNRVANQATFPNIAGDVIMVLNLSFYWKMKCLLAA